MKTVVSSGKSILLASCVVVGMWRCNSITETTSDYHVEVPSGIAVCNCRLLTYHSIVISRSRKVEYAIAESLLFVLVFKEKEFDGRARLAGKRLKYERLDMFWTLALHF